MRNNESVHNLNKEGMKVVSNKVVFFISFLLDCVTTHTACQTVHIPGVGLGGGLEEENAYFQGCYLPSKGTAVDTILVIGHPGIRPPSGRLWWRNRSCDKADADISGGSAWGFHSAPPGNLGERALTLEPVTPGCLILTLSLSAV